MYKLPMFTEEDPREIMDFLHRYPLALLSTTDDRGRIAATHVPTLFSFEGETLYATGHIMRGTDHWHALHHNPSVLAVYSGPNCHVKASWYSDPMSGGTWNYMAVHLRGRLSFLSEEELIEFLRDLTNHYEDDPDSVSNFERLPQEYIDRLKGAIEGFRIRVDSVEAVFKLSQNRDDESYANIVKKLNKKGGFSALMADELASRRVL